MEPPPVVPAPPLTIDLDVAVFRLTAIKKAAYKFGDRASFEIAMLSETTVRVTLTPKRLIENGVQLIGEFRNEVLDQDLRETIAEETQSIRNVLIAQAFSATALLDPIGETGDVSMDPLNIRLSEATLNGHGSEEPG